MLTCWPSEEPEVVHELQLVRSRIHAIPASIHKDTERKLDTAWDTFGGLLRQVQGNLTNIAGSKCCQIHILQNCFAVVGNLVSWNGTLTPWASVGLVAPHCLKIVRPSGTASREVPVQNLKKGLAWS